MSKEIEQDLKYTKKQVQAVEEFIERLPPSLCERIKAESHFSKGWVDAQNVYWFLLNAPPSANVRQGRQTPYDWFWYAETYRSFPVLWRRAFGDDPPVYDATELVNVLCCSLSRGSPGAFCNTPATKEVFLRLLQYGTPTWQREVLREAKWKPAGRRVFVTEPGMELLMKIAPLKLRRQLKMAGPEDTDAEDLLVPRTFEGHQFWILKGHSEEEETLFSLADIGRILRVSKKDMKKILRDHPEYFTKGRYVPGGFFDQDATSAGPGWPFRPPPPPEKEASANLEPFAHGLQRGQEADQEREFSSIIKAANEAARLERCTRRHGNKAGIFSGGGRVTPEPEELGEAAKVVKSPQLPSKRKQQRLERQRQKNAQQAAEQTSAFLRECHLGLEAARLRQEVVHEDPIPEIERRARKGLLAAQRREKQAARAEALYLARKRAQDLLL